MSLVNEMNKLRYRHLILNFLISSLLGVIWLIIFTYLTEMYPLSSILILGVLFPIGAVLLHTYIYWKTPPLKVRWFIIATFGMAIMPLSGISGTAGIILLPIGFFTWLFCIAKAYKQ